MGCVFQDNECVDYREMAVGVCQRFRVRANSRSSEVEFALGWDMQVVNFGKATRFYKRFANLSYLNTLAEFSLN